MRSPRIVAPKAAALLAGLAVALTLGAASNARGEMGRCGCGAFARLHLPG